MAEENSKAVYVYSRPGMELNLTAGKAAHVADVVEIRRGVIMSSGLYDLILIGALWLD